MPASQSLKNHARLDPPMHFFVQPVLLVNVIFSIYATIRHWPQHSHLYLWWIVVAFALLVFSVRTRENDLKVQDRIIRLEERLRLQALLPAADLAHIDELSIRQLVALRFAPDAEIPALVHKALTQNLEPKAIKQNIVNWRADTHRV
jgi:Family of unknown function (DUF6526)